MKANTLILKDAGVPTGGAIVRRDLNIADGLFVESLPTSKAQQVLDLGGRLVLPGFADIHTHIDKAQQHSYLPNPDGTYEGALAALYPETPHPFDPDDLRRRMDFSLRSAYAHGTVVMRTQIDSFWPDDEHSLPVLAELQQEWRDRIRLDFALLTDVREMTEPNVRTIAKLLANKGGTLGGVLMGKPGERKQIRSMIAAAEAAGIGLDLHVDETLDPSASGLETIADTVLETGFRGPVLCAHCCALTVQSESVVDRTLDKVAEAGIGIVALPMCNAYLLDRQSVRTPRWRPGTLVHEMRAKGIPVAFSSDNARDPFFAYGDLDMLEVMREATRLLHLDHGEDFWLESFTTIPAALVNSKIAKLPTHGEIADFVVFEARTWSELLSRPHSDRQLWRSGRRKNVAVPSYAELDIES